MITIKKMIFISWLLAQSCFAIACASVKKGIAPKATYGITYACQGDDECPTCGHFGPRLRTMDAESMDFASKESAERAAAMRQDLAVGVVCAENEHLNKDGFWPDYFATRDVVPQQSIWLQLKAYVTALLGE